jgi:DNA-binding NarL/FixJ family response regulator
VGKVADSYRAEYAYGEGGRVSLLVTYAGSAERPNVDMVIEEREKRLIDSAVSLLGNVLLRLETTEAKVEQARELERKNIALREVLHEIEHDREALVNNAMAYIDSVVMPFIHELRHSPGLRDADRAITVHLSRALRDLFETDPVRIMRLFKDLTPRETEIAGLIRSGMTTKEIGEVLHIAATTVERHRNTIRRKLGLRGRDANLTTYLRFPG